MLYPIMKTKEEVEEMINTRINKDLNVERLNHMIKENKTLEELIQRYAHVRNSGVPLKCLYLIERVDAPTSFNKFL